MPLNFLTAILPSRTVSLRVPVHAARCFLPSFRALRLPAWLAQTAPPVVPSSGQAAVAACFLLESTANPQRSRRAEGAGAMNSGDCNA